MKVRRRKKKPVVPITTGHYMQRAKGFDAWVCVADHQCGEVRDRHGRPFDIDRELKRTGP